MNWKDSRLTDQAKDKIQTLLSQFDKFIHQTHDNGTQQDEQVLNDWKKFKIVLESNPNDMEAHQAYVKKMNQNLNLIVSRQNKQTRQSNLKKSTSQLQLSSKVQKPKSSKQQVLDKDKLLDSVKIFSRMVQKNNRDILKE